MLFFRIAFLYSGGSLDFFLLCKVVTAELAEYLILDFAKDIVFIKPFEQGCQLGIPALEIFEFALRLSNIITTFGTVFLRNVLGSRKFMLSCMVGYSAKVIQNDFCQLSFSDVMR